MSAAVAFVAAPVTAFLVWATLRSPLQKRIVAEPARDRWHERETPTLGGIAIFGGILAGVGAAVGVGALRAAPSLLGILGGAAVVFRVGIADDIRSLGPLP